MVRQWEMRALLARMQRLLVVRRRVRARFAAEVADVVDERLRAYGARVVAEMARLEGKRVA